MLMHLNQTNFESEVINKEGTVVVDFFATWCGPCKMIARNIEALANNHLDMTVGKIDVDQEMELASRFGVSSIPTIVVFKNGKEVSRMVGYRSLEELESSIR